MVRRLAFALFLAAMTPVSAQESLTPNDLVMFFIDSVLGILNESCVGTPQDCQATPVARNMEVSFEFNSARLAPDARKTLDIYVQAIQDIRLERLDFTVEGHTDSQGDTAYNMKLSQDRAAAVQSYLISQGVDPSRLSAMGFGQTRPLTENTRDPKNRRVEIRPKLVRPAP